MNREERQELNERRGNADVEKIVTKLRGRYRSNELMTFRQFLDICSDILS